MRTHIVINQTGTWVEFGGYDDCLALAYQYCREHPEEETYLLRQRGGERSARYVFAITNEGHRQLHPPKFMSEDLVRSLRRRKGN